METDIPWYESIYPLVPLLVHSESSSFAMRDFQPSGLASNDHLCPFCLDRNVEKCCSGIRRQLDSNDRAGQ